MAKSVFPYLSYLSLVSKRTWLLTTVCTLTILLAVTWITIITHAKRIMRMNRKQTTPPVHGCDFPIVYNKPPKTASSFLQDVISNWSRQVGRNDYRCSRTPLVASAVLPECIPRSGDSCGILNSHIFMTPSTRRLLSQRLPKYLTLTSIRYPPHRIISMFLFTRRLRQDQLHQDSPHILAALDSYLRSFNPWRLYNYHTGDTRTGTCPLREDEVRDIYSFSATVDIVVDVSLRQESNVILKHFDLFQIPAVDDLAARPKERGTTQAKLPQQHLDMLRNISCVEMELHRALQVRMASLYELASGQLCLTHGVMKKLDSCIARRERQVLTNSWLIA